MIENILLLYIYRLLENHHIKNVRKYLNLTNYIYLDNYNDAVKNYDISLLEKINMCN